MAPVPVVRPKTIAPHPFAMRACSALSSEIVPGSAVPTPIVVPALVGKKLIVPVPDIFPLITGLTSVWMVRLLAPTPKAELTVITPVVDCNNKGSAKVNPPPTLIAPVCAARPITIFPHVLSALPRSVLLRETVPACPVPTPMVVAAVNPWKVRVPVPFIAALICGLPSVLNVILFVPTVWVPAITIAAFWDCRVRLSFHVRAPTVTVPVPSVRPTLIFDHPLTIFPTSVVSNWNDPG